MNEDKNILINRKRTVLVDNEDLPLLQRQSSQMMNLCANEVISQRRNNIYATLRQNGSQLSITSVYSDYLYKTFKAVTHPQVRKTEQEFQSHYYSHLCLIRSEMMKAPLRRTIFNVYLLKNFLYEL